MSEQELTTTEEVEAVEEATEDSSVEETSPAVVADEEASPPQPKEAAESVAEESLPTETVNDDDASPNSILELTKGQHFSGTVKNIAGFGAFVDIGLPQDGLVHISELAKQKVEKVDDIVSVGQEVDVWIKRVDKKRGRISLTMIKPLSLRIRDIEEGSELEGTVSRLESYGAFINIGSERDGLVHISQITHDYIKHPEESLTVGDTVNVQVLKVNRKKRQVDLSIKALLPPPQQEIKAQQVANNVEKQIEEEIVEEPVPTAMAIAYAAMQDKIDPSDESDTKDGFSQTRDKRKKELDDVLSRTLATSD